MVTGGLGRALARATVRANQVVRTWSLVSLSGVAFRVLCFHRGSNRWRALCARRRRAASIGDDQWRVLSSRH